MTTLDFFLLHDGKFLFTIPSTFRYNHNVPFEIGFVWSLAKWRLLRVPSFFQFEEQTPSCNRGPTQSFLARKFVLRFLEPAALLAEEDIVRRFHTLQSDSRYTRIIDAVTLDGHAQRKECTRIPWCTYSRTDVENGPGADYRRRGDLEYILPFWWHVG
jgi:hypothetical protein